MKRSVGLWQLVGFAATSLVGTLLHFLYEWLGQAVWIAPFSGVNESTWEHMKLLFWPMFVFALVQSLFFRDRKDFWCIKLRGILAGLLLIPVLFYTYNGVIGHSPDWINIAIFFVSAAVAYVYEWKLFGRTESEREDRQEILSLQGSKFCLAVLCIIGMLFIIFTFKTPEIGIFKDPVSKTYGI
ncbi:MAG: hypothetical protein J6R46_05915 [Clostridia bacterium]|nr:hypothetical protein [Clostridia bacterium]